MITSAYVSKLILVIQNLLRWDLHICHCENLPCKCHIQLELGCIALDIQALKSRCEESTHWKRPWCWERMRAREDETVGCVSPTHWTLVRANSGRWWRTGKPGVLRLMGSESEMICDWPTIVIQAQRVLQCFSKEKSYGLILNPKAHW